MTPGRALVGALKDGLDPYDPDGWDTGLPPNAYRRYGL